MINGRGLLLPGLVSRKTLLTEFVIGSLLIHNIYLLFGSHDHVGKGPGQNSASHKAHAHGALLTDIARMLQTAVPLETIVLIVA